MTELTLEQLRFAREIGATHRYDDLFWKNSLDVKVVAWSNIGEVWRVRDAGIDNSNSAWDEYKINFAPLDEAKQPEKQIDMVNKPPHYQTDNGIECIDAIRAALGLDGFIAYCRGNAIKYGWRAGKKDEAAQDLRKAAWYLERAAQELGK